MRPIVDARGSSSIDRSSQQRIQKVINNSKIEIIIKSAQSCKLLTSSYEVKKIVNFFLIIE